MNRRTDKERLLADVLAEESEAGFHGLLDETLRLARRRRRVRLAQRAGGAVAIIVAIVTAMVWRTPQAPIMAPAAPQQNYVLTMSQSLPAANIVTSHPLTHDQLVASTATESVIHTAHSDILYREVGDDELLALAPQPAALVRRGPHEAELVFVNLPAPDDARPN